VASRSSSEPERTRASRVGGWCVLLIAALAMTLLAACVTVRPEDKEFLAEPAMTFGSGGEARAQDEHVFVNREGSFGAGGVSGGGCGCN